MINVLDTLLMPCEALENEIRKHDIAYWQNNKPVISDDLYDLLIDTLRIRNPDSPLLNTVGGSISHGGKITHTRPMLSLSKCYTEKKLQKWFHSTGNGALADHSVATPKIDGMAVSIRYDRNGKLVLGATRGNGVQGEDITGHVKHLKGVPGKVRQSNLEVRGEAYIPLDVFRKSFAEKFANPRNLVAGVLRHKTTEGTKDYGIQFIAYDADNLQLADGLPVRTEVEKLNRLRELGFIPATSQITCVDTAQVIFNNMLAVREELNYETDGVVFKVNWIAQHVILGETSHHPRYAIAYKYRGDSCYSTLKRVEWNVSRTGSINPIAHIDPVILSGATISRVSLHNLDIIKKILGKKKRLIGSRIIITRRGGVIPHIESVVESGKGDLVIPVECPSCKTATSESSGTLIAYHANSCTIFATRRIEHFFKIIEAKGIGSSIIAKLYRQGLIQDIPDLYKLRIQDIESLNGMGTKSAQNIFNVLEKSSTLNVATFLQALGIQGLGKTVATVIQENFTSITDVRSASYNTLISIEGIGKVAAKSIVEGLKFHTDLIERLLIYITITQTKKVQTKITGKRFVFTGKMLKFKRKDAQKLVTSYGGITPSAISAKIDFLVLGDSDYERFLTGWRNSKLRKAERIIVAGNALQIISETSFLTLLNTL